MLRSAPTGIEESVPSGSDSGPGLRVLFDVGDPAQVHLFRNTIEELELAGHDTFVTAREKEVTIDLLEAYGIDHLSLSKSGDSKRSLVRELLTRGVRMYAVARRFQPDVIVGRLGPVPAHVSTAVDCRYIAVSDTFIDRLLIRWIYQGITLPFVDTVCVPESFDLPIAGSKRRPLDFLELAYLHPRRFEPDPAIVAGYDIDPAEPYFILRVAGWDAYHDVGFAGLSPTTVRQLVDLLEPRGRVFISAENDLPGELSTDRLAIAPEDIHHLLYYADLYVGDSETMSTEAAMLGTPAIRTNTMVGDHDENVFYELEHRYGLLRSYADEARAVRAVERLLDAGIDRVDWSERRDQLIAEQPDVTERILETILESAPAIEQPAPSR